MRDTLIILTPGFPENEADTTCLPDRQIFIRVLRETYPDLNIVVISFQYPFRACEYSWHGMPVIALGGKGKSGVSRRMLWFRAYQKLKQFHKENKLIGLLSFWLDECAFIGHMFAKKNELQHFAWLLGQDARGGNRYVSKMVTDGSNLIALSQFLKEEFERNYGVAPQHLVSNGINPQLFGGSPAVRDIDIMGAGSLIPLKQYHLLIEVVKVLTSTFPNIKVVICGDGPELQNLQDKVEAYGLQQNITFTGRLTHAETLRVMQQTKVFLHPSSYEGYSTVTLEALYAGAHVISITSPMGKAFKHHYIVANLEEMAQTALRVLLDDNRDHQPVLIQSAAQMAHEIMALYQRVPHSEEATA